MISSQTQIVQLISTIKDIMTRLVCFSMFSYSSGRSSLLGFSPFPVISVAPGLELLPVLLTHRFPCIAHQRCPISTGRFATRGLGGRQGDLQAIAAMKPTSSPFWATGSSVAGGKSPPSTHHPSCLIYTEPAQGESSSEAIFEFRGLVWN